MFLALLLALRLSCAADPHLASSASSSMHGDSAASDTHDVRGPERSDARVTRFRYGRLAGECAGFAFDRRGRIFTVCVKAFRSEVLLLDPSSLEVLARQRIKRRRGVVAKAITFRIERLFNDTSGGSYFFLDERDRVVIATADRFLRVFAVRDGRGGPRFEETEAYDLRDVAREDKVTAALPDYSGALWFVTRGGQVGVVDAATGAVSRLRLEREQIENSFSVGPDGAFVVTDHALYRIALVRGAPTVVWRTPYDRGSRAKPGQISQGSGSTPTLLDEGGGYVAITDNAEPRMHVEVYRRADGSRVCSVPVFGENRSATENSLIGFGRALIVENNYGYRNPYAPNHPVGGLARVDIRADGSGCDLLWMSDEVSPSAVAKLSVPSRMVYTYTVRESRWSLTGLDFDTGRTRMSVPIGEGRKYDNSWASIVVGPREGQACVGLLTGLACVSE